MHVFFAICTYEQGVYAYFLTLNVGSMECKWKNCTEKFWDAESLYVHIKQAHIGGKRRGFINLRCEWKNCDEKSKSRHLIVSHVKAHLPLYKFKCPTCKLLIKRASDYQRHLKRGTCGGIKALPSFHYVLQRINNPRESLNKCTG